MAARVWFCTKCRRGNHVTDEQHPHEACHHCGSRTWRVPNEPGVKYPYKLTADDKDYLRTERIIPDTRFYPRVSGSERPGIGG